jgi:hypothetical protein
MEPQQSRKYWVAGFLALVFVSIACASLFLALNRVGILDFEITKSGGGDDGR